MTARRPTALAVAGLVALMALLWFLVLAPKREEAASIKLQVVAAEGRRDAANAKAMQAELARASYKRDYASVARLGKATPPQADVSSLVYQLESAARDAKVDFRAVSLQEQPERSPGSKDAAGVAGITPVPFTFTFTGDFFKLHKLLSSVDRFSRLKGQKVKISGRLLTLDSVVLSAAQAGFPHVKVEITARAYVAPIPDELPSASTPAAADPNSAAQVTK